MGTHRSRGVVPGRGGRGGNQQLGSMGHFDLVIVGAGPAGAAAALSALAVDRTQRVLLVDRAPFPRDKTCGDGIGPTAVAALERLGAAHVLEGAARIDRMRMATAGGAVAAGTVARPGYVLPRYQFDARLVAAAVERGATLLRERVTRVAQRDGVAVVNGHLAATTVIGADGANSVVRRLVGAGTQPRRYQAVALRGYAPAPGVPLELDFRFPHTPWPAYGWCFPNAQAEGNVGIVVLDGRTSITRRQLQDALTRLLPDRPPRRGTLRGFRLPLTPGRPRPAHGRVLLAGDAAGLVNPLSGEGIATALISGAAAGACAARHPDAAGRAYSAVMSRTLGRHLRHLDLAGRLLASRALLDSAITTAARSPRVMSDLVELTVGTGLLRVPTTARIAAGYVRHQLAPAG